MNELKCNYRLESVYRAYRARATARANALEVTNISQHDKANVLEHARHLQALSSYNSMDFVMLNRRSPRTRSDFESLYNLLDRWRILEIERASSTLVESSRIAACGLILSKEIELLRAIDSKKTAVWLKCKEQKRRKLLDELSRSVVWQDGRGQSILVDTLRVQRARQHRNMYTLLANENLSVSERIDLLRDLKRVTSMHTCNQSHELVYLINQELDLLACRVDTSRLNWLRNRLKLSFLKLARNALQGLLILWLVSALMTIFYFLFLFFYFSRYEKNDVIRLLTFYSIIVSSNSLLKQWIIRDFYFCKK